MLAAATGLWLGIACAGASADAAPEEWTIVVELKDRVLSEELPVLVDGETLYLPLAKFSALLLIPVEKDKTGNYAGTVSSTGRRFGIDPAMHRFRIDDTGQPLDPADIRDDHDELYVRAALVEKLIALHIEFQLRAGIVKVDAADPLPIEVRWRQERLRLAIPDAVARLRPALLDIPYAAIDAPTADVNLTADPFAVGGTHFAYNAVAGGDISFLSGQLFLTGDDLQPLRDARISVGRQHPDGGAFGLAPVTEAWAGDVTEPILPLAGGGEIGRGVVVSTLPLDRPDSFDTTTIEGDSTPGWIVELYQNGQLIASQQADGAVRYQFRSVPLSYGTNNIRLLHYGPQGQVREEIRSILVGGDMTPAGETLMRAYIGQPGERVLSPLLPAAPSDPGAGFSLEIDHGFSKFLSATAFISRAPESLLLGSDLALSGGIGAQADLGSSAVQGDIAMQKGGGYAFDIGAITAIDTVSLSARYSRFEQFESVAASDGLEPLTSLATARAMTSFSTSPIGPLALSGLGEYRTYVDGHDQATAGIDMRHSIGPLYVDHEIDLVRTDYRGGAPPTTSALYTGALSAFFNPVSVHVGMLVNFLSGDPVENIAASVITRLDDRTTAGVTVNHSPVSGGSSLNVNYSREFSFATLFGQATIDDRGAYTLGLGMSFSVGLDRRGMPFMTAQGLARSGTLAPFVYYDANADGHFDPATDKPLSGVAFRGGGAVGRAARTDEAGDALLTGRSVVDPSILDVDQTTLQDPFWISENGPVAVDARPGKITPLDIAIVDGGEISGLVSAKADAAPVGGVALRLLGRLKHVIATQKTLSDGTYLFEAVPPGPVTVEIVDGQKIGDTKISASSKAVVAEPGAAVDGIDFVIETGMRGPSADDKDKPAAPAPDVKPEAGADRK